MCDVDELRSCVQILTDKGSFNPSKTPVYFTPKYGNKIDLARQLPSKCSDSFARIQGDELRYVFVYFPSNLMYWDCIFFLVAERVQNGRGMSLWL